MTQESIKPSGSLEPWMFVTNSSQWSASFQQPPPGSSKIWSKDWSSVVPTPAKKTPAPTPIAPPPKVQVTPAQKMIDPLEDVAAKLAKLFVEGSDTSNWATVKVTANMPLGELLEEEDDDDDDKKSTIEDELSKQNLYKTELCRSFVDTGICRYGHRCQFAHGEHELRPVLRHPKYKTETCRSFYMTGSCRYGNRCRFIHSYPPAQQEWSSSWDPVKPNSVLSSSTTPETLESDVKKIEDDIAAASRRLAIFEALASKALTNNSS